MIQTIEEFSAGSLRSDELLTITELERRLGIKRATVRSAMRQGLVGRQLGRRTVFLGEDVVRFVKRRPRVTHDDRIIRSKKRGAAAR